jgi:kynureninase
MHFENSLAFARKTDSEDVLREFRTEFHIPEINGKPCVYLTGNSLGLLPKAAEKALNI